MKNIEYLEKFFRKHKLSGRIKVKYTNTNEDDDYLSEVEFPNGDIISINDIVFDIDCELENDKVEQWLKDKKKNDISLTEWININNHYKPEIDKEPILEYHKEIEGLMEEVKETINKVFEMEDGESEDEDE